MELSDHQVRTKVFDFLVEQTSLHGEVLPWAVLSKGLVIDGQRVPLIGPQGIFKPAVLPEIPISIATAPLVEGRQRPYEDGIDSGGILEYRYRGTDPQHRDNVGLRLAMKTRAPLVYLYGVVKGEYLPVWPVYIVGDDRERLLFKVDLAEGNVEAGTTLPEIAAEARRSYVTVVTRQRLHQATFRQRVLQAYRERCAVCNLKHAELLEAAHILPDGHPRGEPIVPNGLALCTLHHAAFDRQIFGVRPNLVIEVRRDILDEVDGPMLRYGLQEIAGSTLAVPTAAHLKPRREFLEERYEVFRRAS
jgi:putative restriction endonuclease